MLLNELVRSVLGNISRVPFFASLLTKPKARSKYIYYSIGIVAVAQIVLPKDCKGNKFCEITKMIVGPTVKWYIAGQFEWKKIKVATGFRNVRLFGGLYFDRLELYVEVSWVPFSDLTCKVLSSSRSYLF